MLSSMQPKFKSRKVSSIRDFPEAFNLIPKAEQSEIQHCLYLAGDDYAYPFMPNVKIFNQNSELPIALEEDSFVNGYNFVPKMEMNSNVLGTPSSQLKVMPIESSMPPKPLPKQRRVSAVRDFPRFCGRDIEDEDGLVNKDMVLADATESRVSFSSQSKIPGGSHIKMCSSKEKKAQTVDKSYKGANLLQATIRCKMYCPQGKQLPELEKREIVQALMAAPRKSEGLTQRKRNTRKKI